MPERNYRALLWTLALLGLGLDQASKYGVFAWLKGVESHAYAVFPDRAGLARLPGDAVRAGRSSSTGAASSWKWRSSTARKAR